MRVLAQKRLAGSLCGLPPTNLRVKGATVISHQLRRDFSVCILRQASSGKAAKVDNLKTFTEIVKSASEKMQTLSDTKPPSANFPKLQTKMAKTEAKAPLKAGDLFWNGSTVELVSRMPHTYQDHLLTMNMRGIVTETAWSFVKIRIGSAVRPSVLEQLSLTELTLPEMTEDEIMHDQEAVKELSSHNSTSKKSYTDIKAVGRPVAPWIFRLAARHLRHYHNEIEDQAQKWKTEVVRYITEELQDPTRVVILPVAEFVRTICKSSHVSTLDFCAVASCSGQKNLQFVIQKTISYVSTDTLMVLPTKMSHELQEAQFSDRVSDEYLRDYVNGSIVNLLSESRAIEELRVRFPEAGLIDRREAAESLKLENGGMWDNVSYKWIYQNAADHSLAPEKLMEDRLAHIRQNFDEPVFCIDSSSSKSAEDGISVTPLKTGANKFRVGIHISDPAAFMDLKAEFGQTVPSVSTVREHDSSWRMSPYEFTKQSSLEQNRPSLSIFADVDLDTGATDNVEIKASQLTNVQNLRLNTLDVTKAPFDDFWRIVQMRLNQRFNRGAFSSNTYDEEVNDESRPSSTAPPVPTMSSSSPSFKASDGVKYVLVEEFMVLANELVAQYCREHRIPIYYRACSLLSPTKEIQREFNQQRTSNNGFIGIHWRKVVSSIRLSTAPVRFPNTGSASYTRFTSPSRRSDDLIVHAQIEAHSSQQPSPFSSSDLDRFAERFQLMEFYHQSSNRDRTFLERSQAADIRPGMKFLGVVMKNLSENWTEKSIYLPKSKSYADYTGGKDLPIEHKQSFTITRVSRYGRSIHVE